ncbi:hypothetical protein GCM10023084_67510 [Streptomyces lacrimifluminis]|uniref:Uncharacterized protein n=1 Tax=Streptomyces lacrimifluminis TaxID=1500077 RepID=A0A917NZA9_9ACTN|nr:hypothetical protein [Streptomyces lacrimifluminis]GGJ42981.1 hypothetical protein GCM10012282_44890 [Streptomyces lacrimifluminis]
MTGVVLGAIGWAVVRRVARNPVGLLRRLVPVPVVVSFASDLSLLVGDTPGPAVGPLAVAALMVVHVEVEAVAVPSIGASCRCLSADALAGATVSAAGSGAAGGVPSSRTPLFARRSGPCTPSVQVTVAHPIHHVDSPDTGFGSRRGWHRRLGAPIVVATARRCPDTAGVRAPQHAVRRRRT